MLVGDGEGRDCFLDRFGCADDIGFVPLAEQVCLWLQC